MDTGPSNKSSPNTISDNQMDHGVDYEMSSVRENEELRTVMLQILFEDLQEEGFSYLLTNRLSQDGLENFFSVIRAMGGGNTNPSAAEFACRFR